MKVLWNARERPWSSQFICIRCDSKLEVDAADLTRVSDMREGSAYTFTCPICRVDNWIDGECVPEGLVP